MHEDGGPTLIAGLLEGPDDGDEVETAETGQLFHFLFLGELLHGALAMFPSVEMNQLRPQIPNESGDEFRILGQVVRS